MQTADMIRTAERAPDTAAASDRDRAGVAVLRGAAGHGRASAAKWIEIDAPKVIGDVPTGAVAIVKGRLLREEPRVLHASPIVAVMDETEFFLALDPA